MAVNRLLPNIEASSDVLTTMIQNSLLVASSIKSNYLNETEKLIRLFSDTSSTQALSFQKKSIDGIGLGETKCTSAILESLRGKCVGALDGGQGKGMLGTTVPFVLRTVVFKVRLGDKSPERESFSPSYFMVNQLSGGAMGTGEQALAAIMEIFELKSALLATTQSDVDIMLLHGPLTRPFNIFLGQNYYLSESDIEIIIGKDLANEYRTWKAALSTQQREDLDRFSSFGVIVFLLGELFKIAQEKHILLCGVVERTSSSEFIQQILCSKISEFYHSNERWFKKVTGRAMTSPQDQYVKGFLDALGYNDPLILGALLRYGEYSLWRETRSNRYQLNNRKQFGLPTGFITGQEHLSKLVPITDYSYIRTSDFNAPFRVEIPGWLDEQQKTDLISAVFAFSQFLPQYAFPINLDIVDKLAKVPNWMTHAFISMISNEIYESAIKEGVRPSIDYSQMLEDKFRDWELRPGVKKNIA